MNALFLDLETFSSVDLGKCGVYKYAASPDFEILLFAYSVDGGEVRVADIASGEDVPDEILAALEDDAVRKQEENAMGMYNEGGKGQISTEISEKLYGDLQLDHRERIAANAVMLYLYRCGGNAATRLMNQIVDVKVFQMGTVSEDGHQTGAALPVQSRIEGARLAALIDTAVEDAVRQLDSGWKAEETEAVVMKGDVVGMLASITGKSIVEGMSAEFAEFVVWCSRWVREL